MKIILVAFIAFAAVGCGGASNNAPLDPAAECIRLINSLRVFDSQTITTVKAVKTSMDSNCVYYDLEGIVPGSREKFEGQLKHFYDGNNWLLHFVKAPGVSGKYYYVSAELTKGMNEVEDAFEKMNSRKK